MKLLGGILIALGLVGVLWGGVQWIQPKTVVDMGPIKVTHDEHKSLPIPPVAGAVCLVAGVLVLVSAGRGGGLT